MRTLMQCRRHLTIAGLCAAASISLCANGAIVTNPSFETGTPVFSSPFVTDWRQDGHAFATAENGITPAVGNRMLKFLSTSFASATVLQGSAAIGGDVRQIVDMSSPADQSIILAGGSSITVSSRFNRVIGPNVDTQFVMRLESHTSFANAQSLILTATNTTSFFTDANLTTWETLSNTLALPTSTKYVSIIVSAYEDIVNDPGFPEFDGQYADDVQLTLSPEPSAFAVLSLLGMIRRRRRAH